MRKNLLLTLLLLIPALSHGQVVFQESFDGTTFAPSGWTNSALVSPPTTNIPFPGYTWFRGTGSGSGVTPPPNPTPHTGAGFAYYPSYDIDAGGVAELSSPAINLAAIPGTYVLSFWVYNYSLDPNYNDSLRVFINTTTGSAGGTMLIALAPTRATTTGWAQYTVTIPATYNSTTNYIVFRGVSGWGYNIYLDDIIVRTQTPPPPTVTNNGPVCPGSSLVITATSDTNYKNPNYTLTGPGISSTPSTTGIFTIPNVSSANAGTFNVTVTSGGFTSAATSTSVVVYSVPVVTITNIVTPTTCTNTSGGFTITGLNPSTNYTLSYRKNGVRVTPTLAISSSASGTYVLSGLQAATYDSIRVLTSNGCYSAPVAATVPAPGAPNAPILSYNGPVCPGSTLTLTVTNPEPSGSYAFSGPTGFAPASTTATSITRTNMQITDSGQYCAIVTSAIGCPSVKSCIGVVVTPRDAPPIPNNVTYCQFDIALPLTAQGANLNWWVSPQATTPLPSAPVPSTATATGVPPIIYYVSQTVNPLTSCESPRVPITVTVKPKPQPPVIPQPIIQICQYEQMSPLSASGSAVRWFATPTGGVGSTTAPTPNTLVSGTFYYYASQTVNGCESDRAITTVIVKPKPQPPAVTSPLQLCQGDPMGPVSALGRDLLWYSTPVGGVGVPVAPVPSTGYEDSFKYYVTQTVSGCESDRALLAVYVNYRPNGIITANSPWVCADEDLSFNYYGNARPDAQYAWYAPPGTHTISGGTTQGPFIVHFDSAGTRVIKLTINNKGCISDLISAPITVRPLPVISYVNRQDVCEHDLVNIALSSQTSNISSFHFNFGSDDAIVEYSGGPGGPFGIRYPKSGHYQVSVTATANTCTSKPKIQDIYVHALPDATIHPGKSPVDICASDTLFLQVAAVPEGAVYTWTPAAYFQGHKDTLNNSVFAVVSQTSEVKVHIKTAFGCEATDSIKVSTKPCCGVFFPNAFAPTGNVIQNRLFRPITNGVHRVNNFRIVNRWGQVMYESKVERNGWDGTYNGVPQDMGTYYYYISYRCEGKDVEERGEFILLR